MSFVHLHLHSEYSCLDGAIKISELVQRAVEYGMPAVAVTDHGNMFGAIELHNTAKKAGIKPVFAFEAYVAPDDLHHKKREGDRPNYYHMTLLARTQEGYQNLMKLTSIGYVDGFFYKPRIDHKVLAEHAKGLTVLSGCLNGELMHLIRRNDEELLRERALYYKELFEGHFYLEIQRQGIEGQEDLNQRLIALSAELDIPLVATNDCHYLKAEDWEAHDLLLAIQTQTTIENEDRFRFTGREFYFKSPKQMADLFKDVPEAIENSVKIAEACHVEIKFGDYYIPGYDKTEGMSEYDYLRHIAEKGLEERFVQMESASKEKISDEKKKEYYDRLSYELGVIKDMQFPAYFLIVWDYVQACKKMGIPVGPGRGSAAGSLMAYSIGITDIDPIHYDLFFERFLNPGRISMPDIDIDFCQERREDVIRYIKQRFGEKNTTQIITFSRMKAKAVIRDVGRALGYSYGDVDRVAKLVPLMTKNLESALEESAEFAKACKEEEVAKRIMKYARRLEGLCRNFGIHAAGLVITPDECDNYIPLAQSKEMVTSQYSGDYLEPLGLLKMDILGLKTLTVIKNALDMIEESSGKRLDFTKVSLEDPATYELLRTGKTSGIFQLESGGMQDLLIRLRPESFSEIPDLLALYRPGPLQSGMVEDYVQSKRGNYQQKPFISDTILPILESTKGVIVYQEQIMQISRDLSGFSMSEADNLRKAMGKKDEKKMAELKEKFVEGAVERGEDRKKTETLFDEIAKFAQYCFNKSHSVAYAYISFQTAYLKAHHTVEFMAALMNSEINKRDDLVARFADTKEMGIEILPPDINNSVSGFSVKEGKILFGLSAIKNVGSSAVGHIIEERKKGGAFKSLLDFLKRINLSTVNKRVLENLVKSGACDCFDESRRALFLQLDEMVEYAETFRRNAVGCSGSLFGEGDIPIPDFQGSGEVEWEEREKLAFEKEALGFYVSGHPLQEYAEMMEKYVTTDALRIQSLKDKQEVTFAGVVAELSRKVNKRKETWCICRIEDLKGSVEVLVYSKVYPKVEHLLSSDIPLLFKGQVMEESSPENDNSNDDSGMEEDHAVRKVRITDVRKLTDSAGDVAVELDIKTLGTVESDFDKIERLIRKYPGSSPLILNFIDPDGVQIAVKLGKEYRVAPVSNFLTEAKEAFGEYASRCVSLKT